MNRHMLVALRRRKDKANEGLKGACHKVLIKDSKEYALQRLENLCEEGEWRIYRTVNTRNLKRAAQLLQVELIYRADEIADRIDQVWKSILMQPKCKADRRFLIDIDSDDILPDHIRAAYLNGVTTHLVVKTPNGWHMITDPFDSRQLLEDMEGKVEIKKDALVYVKTITKEI